MLGRFLAVFGLLFLVTGCSTAPTPPHRYPMVEIPDAKTADVALFFANSFRTLILSEQQAKEKPTRVHEILSADANKVVVKANEINGFRYPVSYIINITPTQTASAVVVDSRMSVIQNAGSSYERLTDLYDAGEVDQKIAVGIYQRMFQAIAANFNAARGRAAQMPPAGQFVRPLAFEWEGHLGLLAGTVTYSLESTNIAVTLPNGQGGCTGFAGKTPTGDWSLSCTNGLTAAGTYTANADGKGSTGSGLDNQGRKIKFSVGGSDIPQYMGNDLSMILKDRIGKNFRWPAVIDRRPRLVSLAMLVTLNNDGYVVDLKEDAHTSELDQDPDYRALAANARQAIQAASPIPVPKGEFTGTRTFRYEFNNNIK
ncbi:hypothetical protein CCC_02883 [Paramagnetospirillum magnetotacticum MS-1]|uniref:Uncharacterized protein n=1 Tax=Paramagnetospirillum magnetotacticum MS-1 TaxID=272627 RepID=A0A0C2YK35_PARME|nr:hypothetical protein [Paramagnetospirillum magnetotacticum]KIM00095.1 hypothetical protein CCC_02883 [Paramagnetospirillum magnetotacticum MS-1]